MLFQLYFSIKFGAQQIRSAWLEAMEWTVSINSERTRPTRWTDQSHKVKVKNCLSDCGYYWLQRQSRYKPTYLYT